MHWHAPWTRDATENGLIQEAFRASNSSCSSIIYITVTNTARTINHDTNIIDHNMNVPDTNRVSRTLMHDPVTNVNIVPTMSITKLF